MSLSKACILEITDLSHEAERLARGSASDRKQADVILQRIGNLRSVGISSNEIRAQYSEALAESLSTKAKTDEAAYRNHFDRYVAGRIGDAEMRDFLAGSQTLSWAAGVQGGYMVPFQYDAMLREAMAQVDEIFSADTTGFTMTDGFTLQPEQVSGYDLSTVSATLVGESVQQNPQTIPPVLGTTLRNNLIFRASFAASYEASEDIPNFAAKIVRASGVALARRIGTSVLTGRGGADISGVVGSLGAPSLSNATNGKIVLSDLNAWYFAVNKFYRSSPKAGWLMTDGAYKFVRAAVDGQGRPLLDVEGDDELLLGKTIHICPSLATAYSSIGFQGAILWGDLSSIVVRMSRPQLQRSLQAGQADLTAGRELWNARARCDATYFDASSGTNPPLVLIALS